MVGARMEVSMRRILLAGVALLVAAPAFAADIPARVVTKAAPVAVAPSFSWTGLYIGGNVGGLWSRKEFTSPGVNFTSDPNGWLGGIQGGFDWQTGMWVFGVQADYDWADASADTTLAGVAAGSTARVKIKSVASVTGRLGIAIERNLLYVKGGGAWVRDNYDQFVTASGVAISSATETRSGGTVGVGWEYAFLPGWSGFVEYDHYFLGTKSVDFTTPGGVFAFTADIKQDLDVVKGGINYRFNLGKSPFGKGPVTARY